MVHLFLLASISVILMLAILVMKQPWSVPEVLRPLYESSTVLSQKTTMVVSNLPLLFIINSEWNCCIEILPRLVLFYLGNRK